MATKTKKAKKVTFLSKIENQRLVKEPAYQTFGPTGRIIDSSPGVAVEFTGHSFTTDDPELVDWLTSHRLFNVAIWDQATPPDEPRPTIAEQTQAIASAAARRDVLALRKVIETEKDTHNRDSVLLAAEAALEEIAEGVPEETLEADESAEGQRLSTSMD